jgi:hypothetical protein
MDAGEVRHWNADVNGVSIHVAERGPEDGPAVLLLHGFPELWLSWRHQMAALAARGFRALAPDLRGYGDSSAPSDPAAYSIFHIVGDVVALLDHLQLTKVHAAFSVPLPYVLLLVSRLTIASDCVLCAPAPPSATDGSVGVRGGARLGRACGVAPLPVPAGPGARRRRSGGTVLRSTRTRSPHHGGLRGVWRWLLHKSVPGAVLAHPIFPLNHAIYFA